MSAKFANNASSRLAVTLSSSDTELSVQPGDGAKYPSLTGADWFPLTLVKATGELEIVKCTARSGDLFTIERSQENTTAKSFNVGDRVDLRLSEGAYESRMAEKFDKAGGEVNGDISVTGNAGVDGDATIGGAINAGSAAIVGNATVAGESTLTGDVTMEAGATVAGDANLNGAVAINKLLKMKKASTIAAASTVDLTQATGPVAHINGTTGITAWTMAEGQMMDLIFDTQLVMTYHVTNNNLPGNDDIVTNPGDRARFYFDGTTVYCLHYQRVDGTPVQDLPAGAVQYFSMVTPPQGWLKANGSALSRSLYRPLFEALVKSANVTISIASPGVVTWPEHGWSANDKIYLWTDGALPTGLAEGTAYYIVGASITPNTFQLSATPGGAAINTSGTQSGTHTAYYAPFGLPSETTFNIPDLRGEFIRGWDDTRGVDVNRAFGQLQLDAFQGHKHRTNSIWNYQGGSATISQPGAYNVLFQQMDDGLSAGAYGTPRVASETRPRNVPLLACIKI